MDGRPAKVQRSEVSHHDTFPTGGAATAQGGVRSCRDGDGPPVVVAIVPPQFLGAVGEEGGRKGKLPVGQ